MHEMQHPVPTLWRTSVGPDGEKGWVSAWGCRRRLHLHSSAQLFVEKHPDNAQPLTQLCSPSQAQHFFMAPKTGGVLQAWEMSWIQCSGSKWNPLRIITSDVEIENPLEWSVYSHSALTQIAMSFVKHIQNSWSSTLKEQLLLPRKRLPYKRLSSGWSLAVFYHYHNQFCLLGANCEC